MLFRSISTANLPLYGIASQTSTDGYYADIGSTIAVMAQTNPAENGIYIVAADQWRRASYLSRSAQHINGLLVSPARGNSVPKDGPNLEPRPVAYRMQIPSNFVVETSPITFGAQIDLTQLHLPINWTPVKLASLTPDKDTGLTTVQSGTVVTWQDFIPDSADRGTVSNDKVVWRLRMQCGTTMEYSRAIILRSASKLGINAVSTSSERQ